MSIVASFTPASSYAGWDKEVAAEIAKLPAKQVKQSRKVTVGDMDLALASLVDELPMWSVERGDHDVWQVTLTRTDTIRGKRSVTQELGMWAEGDGVDIGGFDQDVIAHLGQVLADRAGPQVFEDDAGSDAILFTPRAGAKLQPAPTPAPVKKVRRKPKVRVLRIVPLDVLVEDLDPLARMIWRETDDLPPSRLVTVKEVASALQAEAKAHKGWKVASTGTGARWRATLERAKGRALAFAVDAATKHVTIEADLEDPTVDALGNRLAELAGPQGLVAGEESVAVFVPERPPLRG
ncbi:MAG: hypothetical protein SFX73_12375 [Kofleriaceae bacterium]|nr:hypothetical protein [Kofleriaceae bacterium]